MLWGGLFSASKIFQENLLEVAKDFKQGQRSNFLQDHSPKYETKLESIFMCEYGLLKSKPK